MTYTDFYKNIQRNPFDDEAYNRLPHKELHKQIFENIRLKRETDVRPTFAIDKVLFNPPATIVFWLDGTKTVVKCKEGEEFSEWAEFSQDFQNPLL